MRVGVVGAAIGFCLGGCAFIPPLQEDGVAISDIVQRVKCELAYAVPDFNGTYPSGNYQWMKFWTAKVDLSLDVNDQSSLKPNASYTEPMTQVVLPGIGTFSRMFTFGAGGELSTQARRTEKLSFTLSMKELVENRHSTFCDLPSQLGLLGNLGLQEWVSSSLAPVGTRQLSVGFHQPPTGKTASIPAPGPSVVSQPTTQPPPAKVFFTKAQTALRLGEEGTEIARQNAMAARQFALKNQFQATYNAVDKTYGFVEAATTQLDNASDFAWQATTANRDAKPEEKLSKEDADVLPKITPDAKTASDLLAKAKASATASWELLPRDPPLDSIAHTAIFVVTAAANVTPNWTLVHFRGPGLNSPLAAASRIRTNQLDVVLGAPATPGGKALSDEQNRQLFNLQLDALRRSFVPLQ